MTPLFCRRCGSGLLEGVPPGDDRERHYCPSCGHVEYLNPRVRVGCVFRAPEGELHLSTVTLHPGERLQAGVLRALGTPVPEENLVLYCAITDTVSCEVCILFRCAVALTRADLADQSACHPLWRSEVLERFAGEPTDGAMPVYTVEVVAGGLSFRAVERER